MKRTTTAVTALCLSVSLFAGTVLSASAQDSKMAPGMKMGAAKKTGTGKKITYTAAEVKYKAHCGMVYSAADAKKYHYICPMDHKPLVKMASSKVVPQKHK